MKYVWILFVIGSLSACKEGGAKVDVAAAEGISSSVDISEVPIYTYAQLNETILSQANDTTYVVNFWATWCKPCVKELPAFEKLQATYASQPIKVVLVSLDFPEKLVPTVVPFIEKNGIKSTVVLLDDPDANSWIPAISEEWSGAIPATLLFSKTQRAFYERSFTFEELETELKTIL